MGKKTVKKNCQCDHLGHCLFYKPDVQRTDKEGNRLWRPLEETEPAWGKPEPGDLVASDGQGNVRIRGRAIDVARSVAYAKSMAGCWCRAEGSAFWRLRFPVPKREHVN